MHRRTISTVLTTAFLAGCAAIASPEASADHRDYRYFGRDHYHHHHRRGGVPDWLVGAAAGYGAYRIYENVRPRHRHRHHNDDDDEDDC